MSLFGVLICRSRTIDGSCWTIDVADWVSIPGKTVDLLGSRTATTTPVTCQNDHRWSQWHWRESPTWAFPKIPKMRPDMIGMVIYESKEFVGMCDLLLLPRITSCLGDCKNSQATRKLVADQKQAFTEVFHHGLKKKPKLHHPYDGIKLVTRGTSVSDHSGNWLQTVTSSHSIHQKRSINQPTSSPNHSQPLPAHHKGPLHRGRNEAQGDGPLRQQAAFFILRILEERRDKKKLEFWWFDEFDDPKYFVQRPTKVLRYWLSGQSRPCRGLPQSLATPKRGLDEQRERGEKLSNFHWAGSFFPILSRLPKCLQRSFAGLVLDQLDSWNSRWISLW